MKHAGDGGHVHFLVDRLWPRGIEKESVELGSWLQRRQTQSTLLFCITDHELPQFN